jgi:LemA protein
MPATWLPIIVVSVVLLGLVWTFSRYNALVRSKKRVEEAWSGIDVQLRRRASLLPNLMEIVKGYASHEREVFQEVARARGALQQASGAGQAAEANTMLSQALVRVFAVVENYPQLRASENFMSLRSDLGDVEDKVSFARQFYNRTVLDYNSRLETYPDAILAKTFEFAPAEFFEADEHARAEISMSFARDNVPPQQPAVPPVA